jgi:regulator of replication initiation timing
MFRHDNISLLEQRVYQNHMYRTLSDRFSVLNVKLEKVVNEANSEIEALQTRVKTMVEDHENIHHKNEELLHAYRDKSRKLLQTQELYDKVKRKAEVGQMETAASRAVDSAMRSTDIRGGAVGSELRLGNREPGGAQWYHYTKSSQALHPQAGPCEYTVPTRGITGFKNTV